MRTGGVKKSHNLADVIYERPFTRSVSLTAGRKEVSPELRVFLVWDHPGGKPVWDGAGWHRHQILGVTTMGCDRVFWKLYLF